MATVTVHTPEAGVNDTVGAVSFVNGTAQVDTVKHAAELRYFRTAGYTVVEDEAPVFADVDGDGTDEELPKKSASTEVWRAFATDHGLVDADTKSRDELVALYYKETGQ